MRFRRQGWDVPMAAPLVAYWTAWNESDPDAVAGHLAAAVTDDVVWRDPRDAYDGRDALVAAILAFRARRPAHRFVVASEVDAHHDRCRYRWDLVHDGRVLMEGLDIATLDGPGGLITRIDGFFGHPTPIAAASGVPGSLRLDA